MWSQCRGQSLSSVYLLYTFSYVSLYLAFNCTAVVGLLIGYYLRITIFVIYRATTNCISICICIYVYMYVGVHVYVYVGVYVRIYIWVYIYIYIYIYIYM